MRAQPLHEVGEVRFTPGHFGLSIQAPDELEHHSFLGSPQNSEKIVR